jgi:hypothetical protein
MPGRDRTGPSGQGPGTGWGLGGCVVGEHSKKTRYYGYGAGRGGRPWGGGRGRCFGGGRGRMFGAPLPVNITVEEELASLKNQAAFLEEQMNATKNRIKELEKSEKKADK